MKTSLFMFVAAFVLWSLACCIRIVQFDQNCGGHLKRASNANTVEIAVKEMDMAIAYVERNNLTSGYTSILWRTPDEDVGFWYNNLVAARNELRCVAPSATQLERSNVLMKLRETLMDDGEHGSYIVVPDGISRYPNNGPYALAGAVSLLAMAVWLSVALVKYC